MKKKPCGVNTIAIHSVFKEEKIDKNNFEKKNTKKRKKKRRRQFLKKKSKGKRKKMENKTCR
jgi:hypothetical protein